MDLWEFRWDGWKGPHIDRNDATAVSGQFQQTSYMYGDPLRHFRGDWSLSSAIEVMGIIALHSIVLVLVKEDLVDAHGCHRGRCRMTANAALDAQNAQRYRVRTPTRPLISPLLYRSHCQSYLIIYVEEAHLTDI